MSKYLDATGLSYLCDILKAQLNAKLNNQTMNYDYGSMSQGGVNGSGAELNSASQKEISRRSDYLPAIDGDITVTNQNGITSYVRIFDENKAIIHTVTIAKNATTTFNMREVASGAYYFRFIYTCGSATYVDALDDANATITCGSHTATKWEIAWLKQYVDDQIANVMAAIAAL